MTCKSIKSNIYIARWNKFVIILANAGCKLALAVHLPSKAFMSTCSICTVSLVLTNSSIGISSGKPDSTPLKPEIKGEWITHEWTKNKTIK